MSKIDKILLKILSGSSDNNIEFDDLLKLLKILGFEIRIKVSHHILTKDNIVEIINIQPKDSKAKNYQVKQVREIIVKYNLNPSSDEL
jgi:predicted RNA binding protein YcfA (HicA-like mRNA interferase family)